MHITSVEVENYKSFWTPTRVHFDKGTNVILGKNNSGKSALLDILSLTNSNISHQSLKSLPERHTLRSLKTK